METLSEKALEADIKFCSATEVFAALTLALKAIYRLPPDVSQNYIVTKVAIQHQLQSVHLDAKRKQLNGRAA